MLSFKHFFTEINKERGSMPKITLLLSSKQYCLEMQNVYNID